jgi:hypothetical protein
MLAGVAGAPSASADTAAAPSMVLVLDASGSMNEPDGHGSTKIEAAKAALRTIVGQLPSDLQVGLEVYGHRVPSQPDHAKACQDVQLIAPVTSLNKPALTAAVNSFVAKGETPIGLALQKAAGALPAGTAGSIVLVSDGQDSCAPPEPCAVAKQLKSSGVQLTVDTVGLKVNAQAKTQLSCISNATGGTYTDVQDTAKLADTLSQVAATRDRRTATLTGTAVQGSPTIEQAPKLAAGTYADTIVKGETNYYAVDLPAGQRVDARMTIDGRADPDYACCLVATWMDIDGQHLGSAVGCCFQHVLVRMAAAVDPLPQPRTLYLELHDSGAVPTASAVPIVLQLVLSGAEASDSASTGPSSVTTPAAGGGPASAATPAAPAAAGSGSASGSGSGFSAATLAETGGGGLVAGLVIGSVGTLVLGRRRRAGGGPAARPAPVGVHPGVHPGAQPGVQPGYPPNPGSGPAPGSYPPPPPPYYGN